MTILTIDSVDEATQRIHQGQLIAYPTEAVYGLGTDPFNQKAVEALLDLKKRDLKQGFILLIAKWEQFLPLIHLSSKIQLTKVRETWPGPVTWIFPKSKAIPEWVSGPSHETVAIRMTAHPLAKKLALKGPLISSSANISGMSPARSLEALNGQFPLGIHAVLLGDLGGQDKPSAIYDACTLQCYRA